MSFFASIMLPLHLFHQPLHLSHQWLQRVSFWPLYHTPLFLLSRSLSLFLYLYFSRSPPIPLHALSTWQSLHDFVSALSLLVLSSFFHMYISIGISFQLLHRTTSSLLRHHLPWSLNTNIFSVSLAAYIKMKDKALFKCCISSSLFLSGKDGTRANVQTQRHAYTNEGEYINYFTYSATAELESQDPLSSIAFSLSPYLYCFCHYLWVMYT